MGSEDKVNEIEEEEEAKGAKEFTKVIEGLGGRINRRAG